MRPLEIRFRLVTMMRAPELPLHLDALLAWAAVDEANGDIEAQSSLPLAKFAPQNDEERWVWRASRIIPVATNRQTMPTIRTFDPVQWAIDKDQVYIGGPNKLKPGTGPYKAYQMIAPMLQAPEAVAWCVGDPDRIQALLARVPTLGKLGRLDCGRIASVTVLDDPHPSRERWRLRTLPERRDEYYAAQMVLRPPYWRRSAVEPAFEPGSAILVRALQ